MLSHLQHAVDHLAGNAEIVGRIDQAFQFLAIGVFADFLVFDEQVDQRAASFHDVAANVVDQVVRFVATEVGAESHYYRFRHDQAFGDIEVLAHFLLIDLQALGEEPRLRKSAGG